MIGSMSMMYDARFDKIKSRAVETEAKTPIFQFQQKTSKVWGNLIRALALAKNKQAPRPKYQREITK